MKYIELNAFLKVKGLAASGGEAKNIIRSEAVKLNGEIETRNKKKLFPKDKVEYNNKIYEVTSDICLMEQKAF